MFAKMYHLEINVCFKFVLYLCALWNDTSDYLCSTCSSIWIFMYNLDRGVSVRWIFHQYLAHNMRVQFTWFSVTTIRYWWIDNSNTCYFTIVDGVHVFLLSIYIRCWCNDDLKTLFYDFRWCTKLRWTTSWSSCLPGTWRNTLTVMSARW